MKSPIDLKEAKKNFRNLLESSRFFFFGADGIYPSGAGATDVAIGQVVAGVLGDENLDGKKTVEKKSEKENRNRLRIVQESMTWFQRAQPGRSPSRRQQIVAKVLDRP